MSIRGKNLVYRVVQIPIGPAAHVAVRTMFDGLPKGANDARTVLSEFMDSQGAFDRLSENDQAKKVLDTAINFKNLCENGGSDFQMFSDIIPCHNDIMGNSRSALVHFHDNKLPRFLGGDSSNASKEHNIAFGNVDLGFSLNFDSLTQLYEPGSGKIVAEWV